MKKQSFFFLTTSSLSLFVSVPGRFAYGLVALSLLLILVIFDVLLQGTYKRLKLQLNPQIYVITILVAITVLFKQIFGYFFPLMELTLNFSFYIICFSAILLVKTFIVSKKNIYEQALLNVNKFLVLVFFMLSLFLLRDFLSFGTITFPIPYQDVLFVLKPIDSFNGSPFWATISGVFTLFSIILIVYYYIRRGVYNNV